MTFQHNLRTTTTAGSTTVPKTRRSSGVDAAGRWIGPAAVAAAAVAALVGVSALRSMDDPTPTRPVTTAPRVDIGFEPLISAEERAIINGEYPPLVRNSGATPIVMEPLIGVEERAIINGEHPRLPVVDLCATQRPC